MLKSALRASLSLESCQYKMATSGVVDEDVCNKSITDLGLNEWLVIQCKALHMIKPTPIQLQCIPEILKGRVRWTVLLMAGYSTGMGGVRGSKMGSC